MLLKKIALIDLVDACVPQFVNNAISAKNSIVKHNKAKCTYIRKMGKLEARNNE